MTRINTCCPFDLSDSHLIAEYKELPRVFTQVMKAQLRGITPETYNIPAEYTLGKGHCTFFADKLGYLVIRYGELCKEMRRRNFTVNIPEIREEYLINLEPHWFRTWKPTVKAIQMCNERILERIFDNPSEHRWYGSAEGVL